MIEFSYGDIFESGAEALVNPVNCVGICGAGLAKKFAKRFPDNFGSYWMAYKKGMIEPGRIFTFQVDPPSAHRYIFNFPTKRHYRDKSRIEDIRDGLADLFNVIRYHDIKSIAIPALGCGLGGLEWEPVQFMVRRSIGSLPDVRVILYPPK